MRQSILVAFFLSAVLLPAATLNTAVQCGPVSNAGTAVASCSFGDQATNISVEARASFSFLSVFGVPGFNPGFPTDPSQSISGTATARWDDELRIGGLAGPAVLELSIDTSNFTIDNNLALAELQVAGNTSSLPNTLDPVLILRFAVPTNQWFAFNGFLSQSATASVSQGERIDSSFGIRSARLLDQSGSQLSGFSYQSRSGEGLSSIEGAVPEPGTFLLAGAALLGLIRARMRH